MPIVQKPNFTSNDTIRASFHNERYCKAIHIHQLAEIIYVMGGELRVTTHKKRRIAKPGDLVVIYPYQSHGLFTEVGQTTNLWMLLFSDTLIMDIMRTEADYYEYDNPIFTPSPALRGFIESRMMDTKEELLELTMEEKRRMKALLYPVFDEYLSTATPITVLDKTNSNLINETLRYAKDNFFKDVTITDCSKAIGYSKSHISHCLSRSLHATFSELRNSFRISYAKNLLRNKNMSIFNVSLECGFNCERSFDRAFKKETGISPRLYRMKK